ncbi:glycosyltransferase [Cerasicoccus maritimus]|uniref:glycosyltransferase n=1 Tax=Cerasicoccus maritimus TaxID=490089 RepID=UPI0028527D9A|nr:glycosyltransferase [Cerasicoccus maritimus]
MKLSVLMAIGNLSKGGAEHQCRLLMNNLDPARYRIGAMYLYEGEDFSIEPHVELIPIKRRGKWSLRELWCNIDDAIAAWKPDVIHAWLPEVITIPSVISSGWRDIPSLTSHRVSLRYSGDWRKLTRDYCGLLAHCFSRKIVANYRVHAEPLIFRKLAAKRHLQTIPNGLEIERLRSLPPQSLETTAAVKLMYAGRISPDKNLCFLVDLIAHMVEAGIDVHLTLFGDCEHAHAAIIRDRVAKHGVADRIVFAGQKSNWQAFGVDADALVFPSRGEGCSNVVLEALAVSLPVVAASNNMTREFLKHRESAMIVDELNVSNWTDEILAVCEDEALQSRLKTGGMDVALGFSVPSMVCQYEKLYGEILNPSDG